MYKLDKIAFLCHPYHRGGVTRWMADAAIGFAKRGADVYFVTVAPRKPFFSGHDSETMIQLIGKGVDNLKIISIPVGREFEFGLSEYRVFIYGKLLLDHLPIGTPIILSDDQDVWKAATGLYKAYPIIGVLHSDDECYYKLAQVYCENVDTFICVSKRIRDNSLQKIPIIPSQGIIIIPCGIDLPIMQKRTQKQSEIKLIYVGRIIERQKRISDLLKIAQLLADRKIGFHLTIIGDGGNDKTVLQKKITESQLINYISFTGWLPKTNVGKYLSESDILILTSDFEGTPVSMMEALANGCGFVGTRVSGTEDYENNLMADNCYRIYSIGDIEDAVSKILQIYNVPVETRVISARKLAESEFDLDICLRRYISAIETLRKDNFILPGTYFSPVNMIKSKIISILRVIKLNKIIP